MSQAERIKALPPAEQYAKAVACMVYRFTTATQVVFHFDDQSTLTFKKVYEIVE